MFENLNLFPPGVPVYNSNDPVLIWLSLVWCDLTEQSGSNADFIGFILAYLLFKRNIFIYLATPGLSCGTRDRLSLLWQVDSFS